MNRSFRWRTVTVVMTVLMALFFLAPSVFEVPAGGRGLLPSQSIKLGLDLRGGIHMVLEVQVDKAVENTIDRLIEELRRELRDKEVATRNWTRKGTSTLAFDLISRSRRAALDELITDNYPNLEEVGGDGRRLSYRLVAPEVENIKQLAVDQALETIRNRIDEFGVSEPTIQRTSNNGILIQLPGVQDPERAKSLIGRTAQLEFRLVANNESERNEILVGVESDSLTGLESETSYSVEPGVLMSGEVISDARHRPGQLGDPPYISITLNGNGARLFEQITRDNINRRLAIVLDGRVQSAPVIQERIGGGRAVITGNFTLDEARDLAIVLRAGALPAPVVIAEERTVGPSLGRDSIESGKLSFLIGGTLVIAFMLVYYGTAGVVADIALVMNVVLLLGVLAAFQATLTLPGIAGIVLTLGMAVDANVLINERIREEWRAGQSGRPAIDAGYSRALPAILDSNMTTFLAGLILFQFGSGPIKGFALTLCIGIASTIFTAVFAARLMHEYAVSRSLGRAR